jgi:hypothetical protein
MGMRERTWREGIVGDSIYQEVLNQVFSEWWLDIPVKPKILVVACGRFREWDVIRETLGTDIYAIDIDPGEVEIARKGNPQIPEKHIKIWDARRMTDYFHRKFDIITLRHPNPAESIQIWRKILESSLKCLEKDGVLIVTTYMLYELQIILRMCLFMWVKISYARDNRCPDPRTYFSDTYICAIQIGRLIWDVWQRVFATLEASCLPRKGIDQVIHI